MTGAEPGGGSKAGTTAVDPHKQNGLRILLFVVPRRRFSGDHHPLPWLCARVVRALSSASEHHGAGNQQVEARAGIPRAGADGRGFVSESSFVVLLATAVLVCLREQEVWSALLATTAPSL